MFFNEGTVRKSGPNTNGATFAVKFDNAGSVQSDSGIISLTQGGFHTGGFGGDATIAFAGGQHVFSGAGSTAQQTQVTEDTTLTFNADGALNNLNFITGTLTGPADITLTGNAGTWTGGLMTGSGQTTLTGKLSSVSNFKDLINRDFTVANGGVFVWDTGSIRLNNSAFDIDSGGSLEINGSGSVFGSNGAAPSANAVTNRGRVKKNAGNSNAAIFLPTFDNHGVVESQASAIAFEGGGTHTGKFEGDGVIRFSGGEHDFNAGFASTAGTTEFSGATARINSNGGLANIRFTAGVITGPGEVQLNGDGTWSGGDYQGFGKLINHGTLTLSGSSKTLQNGSLNNAANGTIRWTGGGLQLKEGDLVNQQSGTLELKASGSFLTNGGQGRLINLGDLKRSGNSANTSVGVSLSHSGKIDVQDGTLTFTGGGDVNGEFTGPGTVDFASGTYRFIDGYGGDPGKFRVSGNADVAFNGDGTLANLDQTGGTITGGQMTGNGKTINAGNLLLDSGAPRTFTDRTFETAPGANTFWAGGLTRLDGAIVRIKSGGTFTLQAGGIVFGDIGSGGSVINEGTWSQTLGSTTVTVASGFDNQGTVEILDTLKLSGGGEHTGRFNGGTLDLSDGIHSFNAGYQIDVSEFRISGGVNFFNADGSFANLNMSGGTMEGDGTITLTGDNNQISGGTMGPGGRTINTGTLNFTPVSSVFAGSKTIDTRTYENDGTTNWLGGRIDTEDATIQNNRGATFNILNDGTMINGIGGVNEFANNGKTFKTSVLGALDPNPNTGLARIEARFVNGNQAVLGVDTGTLEITGGLLNTTEAFVTGDGGIITPDSFLNNGFISPGDINTNGMNDTGSFTVSGDVAFTSNQAALFIEIKGSDPDDHDQFIVNNGDLHLDGELRLFRLSGFEPDADELLTIITADSITGEFINAPRPDSNNGFGPSQGTFGDITFDIIYNADSIQLTKVVAVPEPHTALLCVLAGLALNGGVSRSKKRQTRTV